MLSHHRLPSLSDPLSVTDNDIIQAELKEVRHFMRIAAAVYGWKLLAAWYSFCLLTIAQDR